MSGKLVMQMWHADYGDASTILVLMALADEANDAGECSVDIPTVAKKARQSERNCRYLLRKLEDLQVIERFEARGRKHHNRYQIHMGNLKNLQPVQVLTEDNLQSVHVSPAQNHANTMPVAKPATSAGYQKPANLQPVQVIKPANPATIAGFSYPLPPDPQPLLNPKTLKPQNSPPLSPQGEQRVKRKAVKLSMPETPEGQDALRADILDTDFELWRQEHYPHADALTQWEWFVRQCLAKDYKYARFRQAFQNSFQWENSPAQRRTRASPNGYHLPAEQKQTDLEAWAAAQEQQHEPE